MLDLGEKESFFPKLLANCFLGQNSSRKNFHRDISVETFIALCLNAFRQANYPTTLSVLMIVTVFGILHYRYGLGGVLAQALLGTISCLLFLWSQSLFATCSFHFIGNLAVFYWVRFGLSRPNTTN
jgi:hypothetical protein